MKLYHGSTVIVDKPLVSYGRDNLDFGKGFYTTRMQVLDTVLKFESSYEVKGVQA